jgi:small subunit ribosomal protein S6
MVIQSTQGDIIKELERRLKVSDAVIKYQTIRLDEELKRQKKLVQHRERRASRRPRKQTAQAPVPQQPVPPPAEQPAAS